MSSEIGVYGPSCPFVVDKPVMQNRWESLTFAHWSYEPTAVQALLPPWLEAETFDGRAWVGLVPFYMRVSTAGGRQIPWASNFCETNVRTYVRDHQGRTGVWFFSLDASRLGAVVVARTTYRLPYFWSSMSSNAPARESPTNRPGDGLAAVAPRAPSASTSAIASRKLN